MSDMPFTTDPAINDARKAMPTIHTVATGIVAAGLLAATPAAAQTDGAGVRIHGRGGDSAEPVQRSLDAIVFAPTKGKPGISSARLAGDPADAGLYVVMVRMAEGATNAPHTHPDGRITTVLRGKILYGLADTIDRTRARVYEAGSYYYTPPNVPHFLISAAPDTLYQEVGVGPSASRPVALDRTEGERSQGGGTR